MNCCRGLRGDRKATRKQTKEERSIEKEIRELFRLFDTNNDKSISVNELGKAMRFLGMSPTQQEISDAMRTLDKNGNGRVDFQEFYTFMQAEMAKVGDANFTHKEDVIRSAFRTFDKDGNGFIDAKELRVSQPSGCVIKNQPLNLCKRMFGNIVEKEKTEIKDQSALSAKGQLVTRTILTDKWTSRNQHCLVKLDRVAMKKLGECLTDKELEDMMKQADIDGDGRINYEEFVKIWCEAT